MLIYEFLRKGLSPAQVSSALQAMLKTLYGCDWDKHCDVPHVSTIAKYRYDLGPISDIVTAIDLARSARYSQLSHDGSNLNGDDTMTVSANLDFENNEQSSTSILKASYLPQNKSSDAEFNAVKEIFIDKKNKLEELIEHMKRHGHDVTSIPAPEGVTLLNKTIRW